MPHLRRLVVGLMTAVALAAAAGASAQSARTVTLSLTTNGVVTGFKGRLLCAGRCSLPVRRGALVALRAEHRPHFQFTGWTGGCVGSAPTCTLALDQSQSVRAVFTGDAETVSVAVGGPGTVVSDPEGIECGGDRDICTAKFPWGTALTLTPEPAAGGDLARWGAACWKVSVGSCTVSVDDAYTEVNAAFRHTTPAFDLSVLTIHLPAKTPLSQHVSSTPPGIECPEFCQAAFPAGTRVVLTGNADARWAGDCVAASAGACAVVVDAPARVVVGPVRQFEPPKRAEDYGVNVTVAGKGTVTAPGIKCGGPSGTLFDCENTFDPSKTIVLTAKPGKHAHFAGWNQFCIQAHKKLRCRMFVATAGITVGAVFRRRH